MVRLTIRRIGNSLGFILPARVAKSLNVKAGDTLYLAEALGGFRLTRHDRAFAEAMDVATNFMSRYRNALRDLAK